ncbi:hypothetical protein THAOC_18168, partial [Thalassiosira oceanica]
VDAADRSRDEHPSAVELTRHLVCGVPPLTAAASPGCLATNGRWLAPGVHNESGYKDRRGLSGALRYAPGPKLTSNAQRHSLPSLRNSRRLACNLRIPSVTTRSTSTLARRRRLYLNLQPGLILVDRRDFGDEDQRQDEWKDLSSKRKNAAVERYLVLLASIVDLAVNY